MFYRTWGLGRCFVLLLKELEEFRRGSESLDCLQTHFTDDLVEEKTDPRKSIMFEEVKEVSEDFVPIEGRGRRRLIPADWICLNSHFSS